MDNMGKNQGEVIFVENEKNWIELGLRCLVKDLTDAFPPNVYIKPVVNLSADKKTVEVHFVSKNPLYALIKLTFEYNSKELLSFSVTAKNSCGTEDLSEQQVVIAQQSKKEQPGTALPKTTTDIVEEMKQIIEKCRDEVNGDIGDCTLYINRPGCMPKNAIEGFLTAINSKVPDLAIKSDNIAAIFIPNDATWESGICIFDKGLYIAEGYFWLKEPVVYWHDLISAKHRYYPRGLHGRTLCLNLKLNNCVERGEIRYKYLEDAKKLLELLTSVANQIKEIDDWEAVGSKDVISEQMETIVAKYKTVIDNNNIDGSLYLKNEMPVNRLECVLNNITPRVTNDEMNGEAINKNDVIALYQHNSNEYNPMDKNDCLCNLLITCKGFYYGTYCSNNFSDNFVYWDSINQNASVDTWDKKRRVYMVLHYNKRNKDTGYIDNYNLQIWLPKDENEIMLKDFIAPMLNDLRKVDVLV